MKRFLSSLIISLTVYVPLLPLITEAATYTAASCSWNDVASVAQSAPNVPNNPALVDGDTVNIPPCSQTNWTQSLYITKGITFLGAGIDVTVIGDNIARSTPGIPASGTRLIDLTVNAPNTFRVGGFTVVGQVTPSSIEAPGGNLGHMVFDGSSKLFRIDHIKFVTPGTSIMWVTGDKYGLIDHVSWKKGIVATNQSFNGIVFENAEWAGGSWGNTSWSLPIDWGTEKFIYVEDGDFEDLLITASSAIDDCGHGGRVVIRRNIIRSDYYQHHGTDSSGAFRSCRVTIVTQNWFVNGTAASDPNYQRANHAYIRGGTAVWYGNVMDMTLFQGGDFGKTNLQFPNLREPGNPTSVWGFCDGTSVFDQNAGPQAGYLCADQPGAGTSNLLTTQNNVPSPSAWVGNIHDPIYIWGNCKAAVVQFDCSTGTPYTPSGNGSITVLQGRDFIYATRPGFVNDSSLMIAYPHFLQTGGGPPPPPPPPPSTQPLWSPIINLRTAQLDFSVPAAEESFLTKTGGVQ